MLNVSLVFKDMNNIQIKRNLQDTKHITGRSLRARALTIAYAVDEPQSVSSPTFKNRREKFAK
jgi:hypothetical protein